MAATNLLEVLQQMCRCWRSAPARWRRKCRLRKAARSTRRRCRAEKGSLASSSVKVARPRVGAIHGRSQVVQLRLRLAVDTRAALQQKGANGHIVAVCRTLQRRQARQAECVNVGAMAEQEANHLDLRLSDGPVNQRLAAVVPRIRVAGSTACFQRASSWRGRGSSSACSGGCCRGGERALFALFALFSLGCADFLVVVGGAMCAFVTAHRVLREVLAQHVRVMLANGSERGFGRYFGWQRPRRRGNCVWGVAARRGACGCADCAVSWRHWTRRCRSLLLCAPSLHFLLRKGPTKGLILSKTKGCGTWLA
ncbi:hypothetical protein CAOG_009370 [Capsaspora owczarzaki ATCC 30864]|uniref:Uncharacterized protein n=1 Tax=Capsaspora owczarzaki (strain ATCC 30864) TaxID=595528 RepID=A0A0D2WI77_CAPO3|nr:hypothetical protein CAOG_009370 [Capsaspora owczarzaki ATCC 30864]